MRENELVPRIRFQGFDDPWEQRKLKDVSTVITKGTTPTDKTWKGPVSYIKTENINFNSGKLSRTNFISLDEHENNLKRSQLQKDDILFSIVGTLGRIGLVDKEILPANTNQQIAIIRLSLEYDAQFFLNLLKTYSVRRFIKSDATIGAQPSLSLWQINGLQLSIPSLEEQKNIARNFNLLDNLIAANEDKLAQLKKLKKLMMQKIFSQEWRFKGFTDPWEQRKFGSLAKFINGRAYKQNELLISGKYPVLRVGNFYTNNSWYYSNLELPSKNYASKGDLLYTWSATFGPHIWWGNKVIFHYHIWKITLSPTLVKSFIFQLLIADKTKLLNNTNGSTMVHITKSDMIQKNILIPSPDEQKKIGTTLLKIDNLIAANEEKLMNLKELKKFLMQNMFV